MNKTQSRKSTIGKRISLHWRVQTFSMKIKLHCLISKHAKPYFSYSKTSFYLIRKQRPYLYRNTQSIRFNDTENRQIVKGQFLCVLCDYCNMQKPFWNCSMANCYQSRVIDCGCQPSGRRRFAPTYLVQKDEIRPNPLFGYNSFGNVFVSANLIRSFRVGDFTNDFFL